MSTADNHCLDEREGEPIPISALQHAVYCLRQAALIHIERLWAENRWTAEGHVLHIASDKPHARRVRGVRRVTALPLRSLQWGVAGIADAVDFLPGDDGEVPFPIEYKRGKPKLHRADEVQLCAQALCLEEMLACHVPEGALFYGQTKRRVVVPFDADLRQLTCATIMKMQEIFSTLVTPKAVYQAQRCRACSLYGLCQPKVSAKSARQWRSKRLMALLVEAEAE